MQFEVLRLLTIDHRNVFVVGDADQAIYGWRGADISNQGSFDRAFGVQAAPPIAPTPLPASAFDSLDGLCEVASELPVCTPPSPAVAPGAGLTLEGQGMQPESTGRDQGQQMRLELNYRSSSCVLSAAMAMLRPAYKGRPDDQLNLVAAATAVVGADGAGAEGEHHGVQDYGSKGAGDHDSSDAGDDVALRAAQPVEQLVEWHTKRRPSVEVLEVADQDHEASVVVERLLHMYQAAEALGTPRPSVAVLYRTNAQALPFERELVRQGVPYQLMQQRSFFERKEVRDALAYLRLLLSDDCMSLKRIINVPPRKIGASTWAQLEQAAQARGCTVWGVLEDVVAPPPGVSEDSVPLDRIDQAAAEARAVADMERAEGAEGAEGGAAMASANATEPTPLPTFGKAARAALSSFHQLVSRYRGAVRYAIEQAQSIGAIDNSTAHATLDGRRLRLAGSDLLGGANTRLAKRHSELGDLAGSASGNSDVTGRDGAAREGGRFNQGGGEGSLAAFFLQLMRDSQYEKLLQAGTGDPATRSRWKNLGEVASMAAQYDVHELSDFLDQVALVSDVDAMDKLGREVSASDAVRLKLMTVHASKGLEFDGCFVVGVEDGLLPHYYSLEDEQSVEEERRLLYVATTRARHQVVLVHATQRMRWGKRSFNPPSQFLEAVPHNLAPRSSVSPPASNWRRAR